MDTDKPAIEETASTRKKLKPAEAAAYLGCAKITLLRWRRGIEGPDYHRIGRLIYYYLDDLDAWIAAHSTRKPQAPAREPSA